MEYPARWRGEGSCYGASIESVFEGRPARGHPELQPRCWIQSPPEKTQPVLAQNIAHVLIAEAKCRQRVGDAREIGGASDFDGDLLAAKAAVHVGADADVAGVADHV